MRITTLFVFIIILLTHLLEAYSQKNIFDCEKDSLIIQERLYDILKKTHNIGLFEGSTELPQEFFELLPCMPVTLDDLISIDSIRKENKEIRRYNDSVRSYFNNQNQLIKKENEQIDSMLFSIINKKFPEFNDVYNKFTFDGSVLLTIADNILDSLIHCYPELSTFYRDNLKSLNHDYIITIIDSLQKYDEDDFEISSIISYIESYRNNFKSKLNIKIDIFDFITNDLKFIQPQPPPDKHYKYKKDTLWKITTKLEYRTIKYMSRVGSVLTPTEWTTETVPVYETEKELKEITFKKINIPMPNKYLELLKTFNTLIEDRINDKYLDYINEYFGFDTKKILIEISNYRINNPKKQFLLFKNSLNDDDYRQIKVLVQDIKDYGYKTFNQFEKKSYNSSDITSWFYNNGEMKINYFIGDDLNYTNFCLFDSHLSIFNGSFMDFGFGIKFLNWELIDNNSIGRHGFGFTDKFPANFQISRFAFEIILPLLSTNKELYYDAYIDNERAMIIKTKSKIKKCLYNKLYLGSVDLFPTHPDAYNFNDIESTSKNNSTFEINPIIQDELVWHVGSLFNLFNNNITFGDIVVKGGIRYEIPIKQPAPEWINRGVQYYFGVSFALNASSEIISKIILER